jgi:hypothetical protein
MFKILHNLTKKGEQIMAKITAKRNFKKILVMLVTVSMVVHILAVQTGALSAVQYSVGWHMPTGVQFQTDTKSLNLRAGETVQYNIAILNLSSTPVTVQLSLLRAGNQVPGSVVSSTIPGNGSTTVIRNVTIPTIPHTTPQSYQFDVWKTSGNANITVTGTYTTIIAPTTLNFMLDPTYVADFGQVVPADVNHIVRPYNQTWGIQYNVQRTVINISGGTFMSRCNRANRATTHCSCSTTCTNATTNPNGTVNALHHNNARKNIEQVRDAYPIPNNTRELRPILVSSRMCWKDSRVTPNVHSNVSRLALVDTGWSISNYARFRAGSDPDRTIRRVRVVQHEISHENVKPATQNF